MIYNPPSWLYKRPRLLNLLHAYGLATPHSQMNHIEKECLVKYASGKHKALEIGTYMGVTATIIAGSLHDNGSLFCVDPFESKNGQPNPGLLMAKRELQRSNVLNKVRFLLGYSSAPDIINEIPAELDFILIDGDHSYEGLLNDWMIVKAKLVTGGVVCLHDTTIPPEEPYRDFGSVKYFNEVIKHDQQFDLLETAYSMNVLKRNSNETVF